MPTCLEGHTSFQVGCPSCEAGNFRPEDQGPTIIGPHGFAPSRDDSQACDICSGVPGDPIHQIRSDSRNLGAQRAESQRASVKAQGEGTAKSILSAVAIVGIVGGALAIGYFLWDSRTEGSQVSNIPTEQAKSGGPSSDATNTDSRDKGSPKWIETLEFAVHQLVNFERQKNALSVLNQDAELADIARAHSKDMALNDFFKHENLEGQTAADRGNAVGYRCFKDFGSFYTEGISENIFQGWTYSSFNSRGRNYISLEELAFEIVDDWMNSPEHRENILTETYDREGIGISIGAEESVWVTQNFC